MSRNYAIILAGGSGTRMGAGVPKQFLDLGGKPVIARTIEAFMMVDAVSAIIIAAPEEHIKTVENIIGTCRLRKVERVIRGGTTRQASCYNALTCREFINDDIVLIHDAARPFVNDRIIMDCIQLAGGHGAAGVYLRATDTIAECSGGLVAAIPLRDQMYQTQTPQAFKYRIIRQAHELARERGVDNATDDVKLVMDAGYMVRAVEGDAKNIKITTPLDYELAKLIAADFL